MKILIFFFVLSAAIAEKKEYTIISFPSHFNASTHNTKNKSFDFPGIYNEPNDTPKIGYKTKYINDLLETWKTNEKMNELLLNMIDERTYIDTSIANSRNVGNQLAHIHNVRVQWLKNMDSTLYRMRKNLKQINYLLRNIF